MKFELQVALTRTTSGAFKMETITEPGDDPIMRDVYFRRNVLAAAGIKEPAVAKITIEIDT